MENKSNSFNKQLISNDEFLSELTTNQSTSFKQNFSKLINNINIESYTGKEAIITFDFVFNENLSNPINKTHGGSIAILIDNITSIIILHFTKIHYSLKDFSISYINQIELNQNVNVIIKCYKLGNVTLFADVELHQKNKLCVSSTLIKNKIEAKF